MADYFNDIGVDMRHLIAGIAGSAVNALIQSNDQPLSWRKIFQITSVTLIGAFCAMYATPLAVWYFALTGDPTAANAVAFIIGMLGMNIADGLLHMAKRWSKNPVLPAGASMVELAAAVNVTTPTPTAPAQVETVVTAVVVEPLPEPVRKPRAPRKRRPKPSETE